MNARFVLVNLCAILLAAAADLRAQVVLTGRVVHPRHVGTEETVPLGTILCFATTEPSLPQAVSRLRASGARRIVVAPWFLAPGLLTDRLDRQADEVAPDALRADVIGDHPLLVDVVLDRYRAALTRRTLPRAA